MAHLLIIGNGFDLAHGLKTDYGSFLKELLTVEIKKDNSNFLSGEIYDYQDLMNLKREILDKPSDVGAVNKFESCFRNKFLSKIVQETGTNWCDIETLYFNSLATRKPKELNDEFLFIRDKLESYLSDEQDDWSLMSAFYYLIEKISKLKNSKILNFNYTSTVRKYLHDHGLDESILSHIHGELYSKSNPIIFGYAATNEQTYELLDKNNNEYLRNIKEFCYKETGIRDELQTFLDSKAYSFNLEVSILGHSCSLSDNLILKDILCHDKVKKIRVFYHNREGYFNSYTNISRVMNDLEMTKKKVLNFLDSIKMPQFNMKDIELEEFKTYVDINFRNDGGLPKATMLV